MASYAALETLTNGGLYEADREAAREIQHSLVPVGNLTLPGVEVAYRFSPFADVGGDFADFFRLPDGLIGVYIGDVVGKGLSAAMYAALVMGTLRGINKTGEDTAAVLALLNKRLLVRPVSGRYCATIYALFNPMTRQLTFSNAGLPYPVLVSQGKYMKLGEGGLPSGVFPGSTYDKHVVRLSPGDSVLFATDGLHELRNCRNEDFGWDRLGELWSECNRKSADESLDYLFEGAKSFSTEEGPHDDITAISLRVPLEKEAGVRAEPSLSLLRDNLDPIAELPVCAAISF
ncbi:MAG: PP2C family protein-serine/threonine phosphatase [Candidatus Acidiferrales bacterium]